MFEVYFLILHIKQSSLIFFTALYRYLFSYQFSKKNSCISKWAFNYYLFVILVLKFLTDHSVNTIDLGHSHSAWLYALVQLWRDPAKRQIVLVFRREACLRGIRLLRSLHTWTFHFLLPVLQSIERYFFTNEFNYNISLFLWSNP